MCEQLSASSKLLTILNLSTTTSSIAQHLIHQQWTITEILKSTLLTPTDQHPTMPRFCSIADGKGGKNIESTTIYMMVPVCSGTKIEHKKTEEREF